MLIDFFSKRYFFLLHSIINIVREQPDLNELIILNKRQLHLASDKLNDVWQASY